MTNIIDLKTRQEYNPLRNFDIRTDSNEFYRIGYDAFLKDIKGMPSDNEFFREAIKKYYMNIKTFQAMIIAYYKGWESGNKGV